MVKIVTHSGGFHTDEVFAVATLLLHLGDEVEVEIIRTRDGEMIDQGDYVVDVGFKYDPDHLRFDHHQEEGAGKHENGIPYASFGLVWKEYGEEISGSSEIAKAIEYKLAMFIDAMDNGVSIDEPLFENVRSYSISDYLFSYWIDESVGPEEIDRIFKRVVSMAKDLLKREIQKAKNILEQGEIVKKIYEATEDKRLIILDKNLAWGKVLSDVPEPLLAVFPSPSGGWYAVAVKKGIDKFERRIEFPEEWAAKEGEKLQKISGVQDAVFCHRGRFLAVARSKQGAVKLAEIALNQK